MGIAALVLGIVSIIFAFTGPIAFVGIIAGVVGIVLAVLARKKEPSGIATGGLITSIIGTALALILYLACVACMIGGKKIIEEATKDPNLRKSFEDMTKDPKLQKSFEEMTKGISKGLKELEKEANKANK